MSAAIVLLYYFFILYIEILGDINTVQCTVLAYPTVFIRKDANFAKADI